MNETPRKHTHILGRPIGLAMIVIYKGVWGIAEVVAGLVVVISERLIQSEIAEDPQDLLSRWVLRHVTLSPTDVVRIGTLLIALGIAKIIFATGIWYRSWFIRGAAMTFFSLAGLYALYHLTQHFSWITLAATIADLGILYYLWRILPHHMRDPGVR